MSSGNSKGKNKIPIDPFFESIPYFQVVISEITIPFSDKHKDEFIYDGTEDIPFKDRDPQYQSILVKEFITY